MERVSGTLKRLTEYHGAQAPAGVHTVLREFLDRKTAGTVSAVAHRIVHGGERLVRSRFIDEEIEAEIERLAPIAPLHNPVALAWAHARQTYRAQTVHRVVWPGHARSV